MVKKSKKELREREEVQQVIRDALYFDSDGFLGWEPIARSGRMVSDTPFDEIISEYTKDFSAVSVRNLIKLFQYYQ